jgi:ABC-type transport system involved in multi-copper enzyme maturation permease subunit
MDKHDEHRRAASQPQPQGAKPAGPGSDRSLLWFGRSIATDFATLSPSRIWTVARLAASESFRLRILGVLLLGLIAIILADLTTRRFDPVFDTASSLIRIGEVVITVIGLAIGIFLSTYSLPHELTSKTIYSLVTKPVSRLEIVTGKMVGFMVVTFVVTFGLGLLSYGYFELRGRQVEALAQERLKQVRSETLPITSPEPPGEHLRTAVRLPTDVKPLFLERIAAHGPFQAIVYQPPTQALAIVSQVGHGKFEWLLGTPDQRANWGFDHLPQEAVESGQARIIVQVTFPEGIKKPLSDQDREVLLRLQDQGNGSQWSSAFLLSPEGRKEITIPPRGSDAKLPGGPGSATVIYSGGKLWVSLCGVKSPALGVANDSCAIEVGPQRFASGSGVMLTTLFSAGKYWIAGEETDLRLMARARFDNLSPSQIGPQGSVVQVDVTTSMSTEVPPDARARVFVVNEETGKTLEATFRPEKGGTALVALERDFFSGGSLSVYVSSLTPEIDLGANAQSIRLRVGNQPFFMNWAKDLLMMWLSFCVLGGIGVMFSTVAGWQVGSLATALALLIANVWPSIVTSINKTGLLGVDLLRRGNESFARELAGGYRTVFEFMGTLLPDFRRLDFGDTISRGIDAPLGLILGAPHGALWHAVVYVLVMIVIGYLFFRLREVAQ